MTASGPTWNPARYLRFADHRRRPALELLARVPLEVPRRVVDLGCGTGELTRLLSERWPAAEVTGVDRSPDMLARARSAAAGEASGIRWIEADAATWSPPRPPDLMFSNAALHWLPDHHRLFPRLARTLAPGGCLAVQMPLSWDLPSHQLMRQTLADSGPDGSPLGSEVLRRSLARPPVADAQAYYDLLAPLAKHLDIWHSEYLQVLEGPDAVLEWVRGAGLRGVLDALTAGERTHYLATYRQRLRQVYPRRDDGRTFYPFRRLFVVAVV